MKFIFFANTTWYLYNFRLATIQRLLGDGHEVVVVSPPGKFGKRLVEHGCRWIPLAMERASLNPLRELATLSRLVGVLRRERPDIVHGFTLKCAIYGTIAARIARVPAVVSAVSGMGFVFTSDALKARMLRPLVKVLLRFALNGKRSLLVLQNHDDALAFSQAGLVAPEHIRVILGSGVNTFRFHPSNRTTHRYERLRVLLAARLLQEKGVREFIEAAAILRKQERDIEFLLAGTPDPGNPHSISRTELRRWTEAGLVHCLGHVNDMPALLGSVHVLALPSYYREGVPKSLIEGAATGLALVTTNQPGCREVVTQDGVDGLWVEPRNAQALAECIARLDDDRDWLAQLGDRAREQALKKFDERLVIQQTLEVYAELFRPDSSATEAMRTAP
ncbi:MAG TPA: glycosyltransferase family 4 protein [Dyella sp.]|uniref:glycosyltransferase family 4 protein n=1 Tax=Dyella sp. TaxID=1869338 RepID=UPI002C67B428|nr:glycosyltransferase family 4 protein [Dyella sp.]HUB89660.1 glycosyltransferase family 4 protein [Dyella sp.]